MAAPHVEGPIDEVDRRLLGALQRDARATLTDLSEEIHLGVSATRARLRSLEERGVITGYMARVNPSAGGFALRAIVRMKVHGSLYDKVTEVLAREPQIVRCVRVTGEACYVAEVLATDMADLERITSELARVGSIATDLVYEVMVDRGVPC